MSNAHRRSQGLLAVNSAHLLIATALLFAFGCAPPTTSQARRIADAETHTRWISPEKAVATAVTDVDAPATAELVALFGNIARSHLGADRVSQLQIRFRDTSAAGGETPALAGILRGHARESGFVVRMLPYESAASEWIEFASITSGPHRLLDNDRGNTIAAQIQRWFTDHAGASVMAEDVQLDVSGDRSRMIMRGVFRRDAPNDAASIAVSCLEGCR